MMRSILLLLPMLPLLTLAAAPAQATADAAYVVLGDGGVAIARAITQEARCPDIVLDGVAHPMALRAPADGDRFPVTVCEWPLPAKVRRARIEGVDLPLPPAAGATRIAIVGDTGCRMKQGVPFQACNDAAAWPFAAIAAQAAATRPDAVLHVGDYVYREAPCPSGDAGCDGSPWGDGWLSWKADVFTPAQPLLAAAPWIAVRGDHESCARAGEGYFRFLDPRPYPASCSDMTAPYAVTLPGLRIIVMDSSGASMKAQQTQRTALYRTQLAALEPADADSWLATHMPFWAIRARASADKPANLLTKALADAAAGLSLAGIGQIVTGHIHIFEAIGFTDGRPNQLVVGTGGTSLDPPLTAEDGVAGASPAGVTSAHAMGFATASRAAAGWQLRFQPLSAEATAILCKATGRRGGMDCSGH